MKATEKEFPIMYFEDNLLFNRYDQCCWAVFRVQGFGYDFKSEDEKFEALDRVSRFIANIGRKAQILMIPVAQDLDAHYRRIAEKNRDNPAALEHCQETYEFLTENLETMTNDYDIFVITQIRKPNTTLTPSEIIKDPYKLARKYVSAEDKMIALTDIKAFKRLARQYFDSQNRRLRLEEVDSETCQWLLARINHRGENNVPIRRNNGSQWTPHTEEVESDGKVYKKPNMNEIVTMYNDKIIPKSKKITIEHSDGTQSYQTFIAMAHLPEGFTFPGSEWLSVISNYDFGIEVCINIDTIEYQKAMKQIRSNVDEIKGQMSHVAENGGEIPDELYENREATDELKGDLKAHKDPLVEVNFLFCIADTDEKRMNANAQTFIDDYNDVEFKMERPFEDQLNMYYDFIPGTGRYMRDYVHKLTPKAIACSMFPAKKQLGDNQGYYIGYMDNGKYVFLDQGLAIAKNTSASAYVSGTLGGGKSFNANLLGYLAALYGGRLLCIDPKGDRNKWQKYLTEFEGDINVINLTNSKEDQGKLDPFIVHHNNMDAAKQLALSMVCELYTISPQSDQYTILNECIDRVSRSKKPSMMLLIKALSVVPKTDPLHEFAHSLARKMKADRMVGMSTLFYGFGGEKGLSFDAKINILQVQNLNLPDPSTPKEDYTLEERISMAIMLPVASFAQIFSESDNSRFKVIIFDESWALSRSAVGVKIMEGTARKGRSQNTASIFIGHSVKDVPNEGVAEAITYKFAFKVKTQEEAERVLEWLGLEISDENLEIVKTLPNATCLFRDFDGNVDVLHFDVGPCDHLFKAFDSNPIRSEENDI